MIEGEELEHGHLPYIVVIVDELADLMMVSSQTKVEVLITRLAQMGVDESGLGDRAGRPNKRFKITGILRDALRQKSMGIVEEIPEKGLVKYAKPVGVVAGLVPTTNPALTPPGMGIYGTPFRYAWFVEGDPAVCQNSMGCGLEK